MQIIQYMCRCLTHIKTVLKNAIIGAFINEKPNEY